MFLDFLLKKRTMVKELPSRERRRVVSTDYLKVFDASDIEELEAPPFNQAQWSD